MTTTPTRAVVFAGGELHTKPTIGSNDLVIAADSGYDHAVTIGVRVDVLVGDLDSISAAGLEHARDTGVDIESYPTDKDATDLELALTAARDRGAATIDIYGGEDGRIDHLLGVALSLSHRSLDSVDIQWRTRTGAIRCATRARPLLLPVSIGSTISLIPVGDAIGVTTTGLAWPLDDTDLEQGTSLGISNEATARSVAVSVREGTVLVVLGEAGAG
jgi:thiamine pyrophosphokinase